MRQQRPRVFTSGITPGVPLRATLRFMLDYFTCLLSTVVMADSSHCFYCREDLGGKKFVRHEGKPVCVRCHTKFCANSCAECHRPIPVESKVQLHQLTVAWLHLSPLPLAIRSCTTRVATGTKSVSAAQSATRTWPRSRSAPKTSASCAGGAAPKRPPRGAMAATNLYWPVLQDITSVFFLNMSVILAVTSFK